MKQNQPTPASIKNILENRTPQPLGNFLNFAVMVLLFQIDDEIHILYNKRAETLIRQPGDICFPGGSQEGNETPLETALRETEEELHISPDKIQLLGQTDYIITIAGAVITPFVGFVKDIKPSDIKFNTDEVAKVFTVPFSFFYTTAPEIHYLYFQADTLDDFPFERISGGKNYHFAKPKIPELFYDYFGQIIWGITAQITHHVVTLVKENEKSSFLPSDNMKTPYDKK